MTFTAALMGRLGVRAVDQERRAVAVDRLVALRRAGSLRTGHVHLAASGLGVAERTVWRWIDERSLSGQCQLGGGFLLSETDRDAYAFFCGNVAAVARARAAVVGGDGQVAGAPVPGFLALGWASARPVTVRTLQRAFDRELTPGERAAWREGEEGRRAADVYLTRPQAPRNQTWEMDNKQLPILVLPPRGPAVCPWLVTVIDDGTRAVLGWAIMLTPHAGTVLTALRMALTYDESRGPFGGVPAGVRVDRGLDFAAEAVRDALAALCVRTNRLPGYTPNRKGKVERFHETIQQTLLCGLPGYTKGPRDAAGKLHGPLSDAAADREDAARAEVAPMRIELLAQRFGAWVTWYNTERPHAGLDGSTPLAAWNGDPSALVRMDGAKLRHLLLAGVERTIGKDGIHFNGLVYVAPEMQERRGLVVDVRYMPHDDRCVEVYLAGTHLCTAYPQGQLSDEQVQAFRAHARAEAKRLSAARRRASARARAELVPLTDEQKEATESRLVPVAALTDEARRASTGRTRRGRSDLLGLRPVQAVPADRTTPTQGVATTDEEG